MAVSYNIVALIGFPEVISEGLQSILKEYDVQCLIETDKSKLSSQYSCAIISEDEYFSDMDFWHGRNVMILLISPSSNTLKSGIVSIYEDKAVIAEKCISMLNKGKKAQALHDALSAREFDVLREIASGKTFKEIADTLNISVNTVVTHRKSISSKLGIRSTSGLSVYAMMHKLL